MKLLVDTNRIIAALVKNGISRKILMHSNAELIGVTVSKEEIAKYKLFLIEKAEITEEYFEVILDRFLQRMIIVPDDRIQYHMAEAKKIMDGIDPDDTPFIAAALAMDADMWSDDKHFKKQKRIKVWTTRDLVGNKEI